MLVFVVVFLFTCLNSVMKVFVGERLWLRLLEASIIVVYVYYCSVVGIFLLTFFYTDVCCCIICLLVYHFFMLKFVVILRSAIICKQVYGFVFVGFFYNFNVKRCKSKTPVSRFFHFRNNSLWSLWNLFLTPVGNFDDSFFKFSSLCTNCLNVFIICWRASKSKVCIFAQVICTFKTHLVHMNEYRIYVCI